MKVEKNKIVFALVLLTVLLFLGAYYAMTFGDEEDNEVKKDQIPVPELEDEGEQYKSKLEALDDIKEEREKNAPSLYPEHMVDEKGYFNPDYMEYEKQRIIDSIYQQRQHQHEVRDYRDLGNTPNKLAPESKQEKDTVREVNSKEREVATKELALEHQLFFASDPMEIQICQIITLIVKFSSGWMAPKLFRQNYRLEMRLTKNATIAGKELLKNTPIYGFIKFQPNRTLISIEHINHRPIKLAAHDLQDGSEGIYIENSFRAEVRRQMVNDAITDINIAGVPQVSGIKRLFQRNNRNIKVTITDNYQLILKLKQ